MPTNSSATLQETPPLVSEEAFQGILWGFFALCVLAFGLRAYVRVVCFHRLYVDDWLMLGALLLALGDNVLCQLGIGYIYDIVADPNYIANPKFIPGADFLTNTQTGLRQFGTGVILSYIGIWVIKFNFLLFFYRLGSRVRRFRVIWWAVVVVTMVCGVAELATLQVKCLFGSGTYIVTECSLPSSMQDSYTRFKVSCILDVVTDALIIGFPISIIWGVNISIRQKIALAGIFALVIFTMVVTIIRGSIFGGVYESFDENNFKGMNVSWAWFWFAMEFHVSYIIACLVSFRALFTKREKSARLQKPLPMQAPMPDQPEGRERIKSKFRSRVRLIQNTLLDTCRTLEGTRHDGDDFDLPLPPPGRMSVDFFSYPDPKVHPSTTVICRSSPSDYSSARLTNTPTSTHYSESVVTAV